MKKGCGCGCLLLPLLFFVGLAAVGTLVYFVFFPSVPEPSATYDCDDSTLSMYNHFSELGFEVTPVAGNLAMDNEEFTDCDHIWLWVNIGGEIIAYDWGEPYSDPQHYEGYRVSYQLLLRAVQADKQQ